MIVDGSGKQKSFTMVKIKPTLEEKKRYSEMMLKKKKKKIQQILNALSEKKTPFQKQNRKCFKEDQQQLNSNIEPQVSKKSLGSFTSSTQSDENLRNAGIPNGKPDLSSKYNRNARNDIVAQ